MALAKKHKRLLAYSAILGGCAILALTFFTISQFEKAKYQASISVELVSKNKLDQIKEADANAIENENSTYHKTSSLLFICFWKLFLLFLMDDISV